MHPLIFWGILIVAVIAEVALCWKSKHHIWQFVGFALASIVYLTTDSFDAELMLWLFVGIVAAQLIVDLFVWGISSVVKAVKKFMLSRKNT